MSETKKEFLEKINERCKLQIEFVEIKSLPKNGVFRASATAYCPTCSAEHTMFFDGEFADGYTAVNGFGYCVAGQVIHIEATLCMSCGNKSYDGPRMKSKKRK